MITPARLDLVIYQGASYELGICLKDSSGVPIDLSDREVFATVWNKAGTTKLFDLTVVTNDAPSGVLLLRLTAEQTGVLPVDSRYGTMSTSELGGWDLRIIEPDGIESNYWLKGMAKIVRGLS